ncbi:hypothetical protein SAMN05428959_1011140 [Duganella sp. CF517]|uniref:hypothetical protein n=1 Tax=Duganella sp. CF517 TaxID=1881038 RepID=UPI0008CD63FE|nr:hypothetical protein [Duganella sp. CF517]SEN31519.1 hypothetical protein SAMN05428959_1011140 [Duganella sp. CF517]
MDDFTKSLKAHLYDRASSPLFFSFALSWCAWNYRYILILISSMSPSDKFLAIDLLGMKFPEQWIYWVCYGIVFPLVTAMLYIFAYPIPSHLIYKYSREQQKKLKEIQTKIDDETPLTQEEARELRKQVRELVKVHEGEIKDRETIIENLRKANAELAGDLAPVSISPASNEPVPSDTLDSPSLKVLKIIAEESQGIERRSLLEARTIDRLQTEHAVDVLLELKYISEKQGVGDLYYVTTPAGRAYLVRNRLAATSP